MMYARLVMPFSKVAEILLAAVCAGTVLWSIFHIVGNWSQSGHDFRVYCAAAQCMEHGENPYLVSNLQRHTETGLTFVYPPMVADIFRLVCDSSQRTTYFAAWTMLLVFAFILTREGLPASCRRRWVDNLYVMCLLLSGFSAVEWNYLTGNTGIVELVVFSIIYHLLRKKQFSTSSAILCGIAWLKVYPLAYCIGCFRISGTWRAKLRAVRVGFLTFGALTIWSVVFFPTLSISYLRQITGGIPGQHSHIFENGKVHNPSAFFLFQELEHWEAPKLQGLTFGYVLFAFIIVLYLVVMTRNQRGTMTRFSSTVLAVALLLPRCKQYALTVTLLPLCELTKTWSPSRKLLIILVVSVLPTAAPLLDRVWTPQSFGSRYLCLLCLFVAYLMVLLPRGNPVYLRRLIRSGTGWMCIGTVLGCAGIVGYRQVRMHLVRDMKPGFSAETDWQALGIDSSTVLIGSYGREVDQTGRAFTWIKRDAELTLPIRSPAQAIIVHGYVPPDFTRSALMSAVTIRITLDNRDVHSVSVPFDSEFEIEIPDTVLANIGEFRQASRLLKILTDWSFIPSEVDLAPDGRELSLRIFSITFEDAGQR